MVQKVGNYLIQEKIGEGSLMDVYRATQQLLNQEVALKVLKPEWSSNLVACRRFNRVLKKTLRLYHPHIAFLYEVVEIEKKFYIAQLLVEGKTLDNKLKSGPLSWVDTLAILQPLALVLDYAHEQGFVHKDIKPSNILLDQTDQPFLADFGLAQAAKELVSVGGMAGDDYTTPYMAPEIWNGQTATPAADIYALSCITVYMLTGDTYCHKKNLKAHLPKQTISVLRKGLAPNPTDRFERATDLVEALEVALASTHPLSDENKKDISLSSAHESPQEAVKMVLMTASGQIYELKLGYQTLGRSQTCDIYIADDWASRQHALIKFDGRQCIIYDQGSVNGTYLNGQSISSEGEHFQAGDQLEIGHTKFSVNQITASGFSPIKPTCSQVDQQAKTTLMTTTSLPIFKAD